MWPCTFVRNLQVKDPHAVKSVHDKVYNSRLKDLIELLKLSSVYSADVSKRGMNMKGKFSRASKPKASVESCFSGTMGLTKKNFPAVYLPRYHLRNNTITWNNFYITVSINHVPCIIWPVNRPFIIHISSCSFMVSNYDTKYRAEVIR